MINGSFTFGMMAALQSVLYSFRTSLSSCVNLTNSLQKTRVNIERIDDILERESRESILLKNDEVPDKLPGILEAKSISYRYNAGGQLVLKDISFRLEQGMMIAVVGSTGCGKSTLLKCLSGLYEPSDGKIFYGGLERRNIPDVVFHSTLSTVSQESMMFTDTIAENYSVWSLRGHCQWSLIYYCLMNLRQHLIL